MTANDIAMDVLERDSRDRQALAILLDQALARDDRLLVERTQMGGTDAYVGSADLSWVHSHIQLAQNLPLLRDRLDPDTGQLIIDAESIDLIQQRPIDWTRQEVLARYLATTTNHKFPPILVVVSNSWVDDPEADEWGDDGRAVRSSAEFIPLDNSRRVGLLSVGTEFGMFALDGQHRLIGINGLMSLIRESSLQLYNKDHKAMAGKRLQLDELLDEHGLTRPQVQATAQERLGIEFIPAVVAGETREEAHRRVASVFVHVNMTAAPLTGGQLAQIDQNNGFAIVSRQQAVHHELLRPKHGRKARVNFNSNTIAQNATVLTTLQTLKEMAERYLSANDDFYKWKPARRGMIPDRPSDSDLEHGAMLFGDLLDRMADLPSYQQLEQDADTGLYRRFTFEKPAGRAHMLFRPIGQIALAQAVGYLQFEREPAMSLDVIFGKLAAYDQAGGFRMDHPSSLWYGVLYDPLKRRMLVSGRDLAARLLQYLVGDLPDNEDRDELEAALANARRTEGEMARDYNGEEVPVSQIRLPDPL
jgi:DGQHR domain-containing protein